MKKKTVCLIAILIFSAVNVFSQYTPENEKEKEAKELKEKAIVLLRDTRTDINGLLTIENRISFMSELANLMWFYDAEEGKKMFGDVTDDFVQLFSRYNADLNTFGGIKDESEFYTGRISPNDKTRAISRMSKAVNVRQQIAMSLAAQDAEMSLAFVADTTQIVTDETFKKRVEQQNERLESQIIAYLALQDIDKALAMARASLKKGFKRSMLGLLTKVYEKDKKKGREFASEILDKVRSELREPDANLSGAYAVLEFGRNDLDDEKGKENSNKNPIFDERTLKNLAEDFANAILRRKDLESEYMIGAYYITIDRFSPSSALRVKNKYKDYFADNKSLDDKPDGANIAISNIDGANYNVDGNFADANASVETEDERKRTEFFEKLKSSDLQELPEQERQKFIAEGQRIVASFTNPTEKIAALSGLAAVVKQLGDEKLASELMDEAGRLVNPQPKNYLDYMQVWTLAGGYSAVEPQKAFPVLENAIYRLNDTIEAFVKVGEFIDVAEDLVIDNEVQLGSFGGSMTQGLISGLNSSEGVIENLTKADFDKTQALANRFSRREVRVLAKMLIIRSVLDDGKKNISLKEMIEYEGF